MGSTVEACSKVTCGEHCILLRKGLDPFSGTVFYFMADNWLPHVNLVVKRSTVAEEVRSSRTEYVNAPAFCNFFEEGKKTRRAKTCPRNKAQALT